MSNLRRTLQFFPKSGKRWFDGECNLDEVVLGKSSSQEVILVLLNQYIFFLFRPVRNIARFLGWEDVSLSLLQIMNYLNAQPLWRSLS